MPGATRPPKASPPARKHSTARQAARAGKAGGRASAKKAGAHLVVAMALAAGCFLVIKGEADSDRHLIIDIDEYGWLAASDSTFRLMFVDARPGPEKWKQGMQATTFGAMNPNFGKLVMGFALYCWGYDLPPPPFFPAAGKGHLDPRRLTPAQSRQIGSAHVPYVIKMRWLIMCMTTACAVALYFVGRAISGPVLGIGAYVGFISTLLVKYLSFAVHTDNLLLLLMLLSVLATVAFVRWWSDPRSAGQDWGAVGRVLLIGALYGATVATKFSGAVICIACGLCILLLWATGRFKHHRAWKTPVALGGLSVVSFTVFVLVNPQLHEDIPGRIAWSIGRWSQLIEKQQEIGGTIAALPTLEAKIAGVYRAAVRGCGPFVHFLPAGAAVLICGGFIATCRRWIVGFRGGGDLVGPSFLVVWAVVVVVMMTVWLPLDWPRYYLPYVPVFCLLQALPFDSAVRWLMKRRRLAGAANKSK